MLAAVAVACLAFSPSPVLHLTHRRHHDAVHAMVSEDVPYREGEYSPSAAAAFFGQRPLAVAARAAELVQLSGGFVLSLLADKALKREEENVGERSQQLLELVTKLGPAFIKVGQALSIRQDLLPAPYVARLVELQDAVPPFSGAQGRAITSTRKTLCNSAIHVLTTPSDSPNFRNSISLSVTRCAARRKTETTFQFPFSPLTSFSRLHSITYSRPLSCF